VEEGEAREEVKAELGDNITNVFLLGEQATYHESSTPFLYCVCLHLPFYILNMLTC
jgi:hypothetical protein